ncbi:MAG: FAD-dependent oxidoreductase [Pseudomonadota bacterium]
MNKDRMTVDVAIIGGGIAGLWALNLLRCRGFSVILFEQDALGNHQTIASQGIIHGGVKYALGGPFDRRAQSLSAMPTTWRDCLRGEGDVDLRGCRVLSDSVNLWTNGELPAQFATALGSKLLRGRVRELPREKYPVPLRDPGFRGRVYRLPDLVIDVPSLVATLVEQQREAIFKIDWRQAALRTRGDRASLELAECEVIPECLLLAAGASNAGLIAAFDRSMPAMQRYPVQQVLVQHRYPETLYGHCVGTSPSPRLTVTSHPSSSDTSLWYLGGDLATQHPALSSAHLIKLAQKELAHLLPWVNLSGALWRTLHMDRVEPLQTRRLRPDSAFLGAVDGVRNVLVTWPVKLTLAPDMGDRLLQRLQQSGVTPYHPQPLSALQSLGQPPLARPPWEAFFV